MINEGKFRPLSFLLSLLDPWRWGPTVAPKRRQYTTVSSCVNSQKTADLNETQPIQIILLSAHVWFLNKSFQPAFAKYPFRIRPAAQFAHFIMIIVVTGTTLRPLTDCSDVYVFLSRTGIRNLILYFIFVSICMRKGGCSLQYEANVVRRSPWRWNEPPAQISCN